jgi:hypothetical protein
VSKVENCAWQDIGHCTWDTGQILFTPPPPVCPASPRSQSPSRQCPPRAR